MATCDKYRDIAKLIAPGAVVLRCKRDALHTGKHITPDGLIEWWGPADNENDTAKVCKSCLVEQPINNFYRYKDGHRLNICGRCDSDRKAAYQRKRPDWRDQKLTRPDS